MLSRPFFVLNFSLLALACLPACCGRRVNLPHATVVLGLTSVGSLAFLLLAGLIDFSGSSYW